MLLTYTRALRARASGFRGVSRISARGVLKVRPHTKSGGGGGGGQSTSGPIYEKWGWGWGGGGQSTSGPIYEKWGWGGGSPLQVRYTKSGGGGGGGGSPLQVRYTKSGGGGGSSPLQVPYTKRERGGGGGQSTSGPIYEKWGGSPLQVPYTKSGGGGGGGAVHFRSHIRKGGALAEPGFYYRGGQLNGRDTPSRVPTGPANACWFLVQMPEAKSSS